MPQTPRSLEEKFKELAKIKYFNSYNLAYWTGDGFTSAINSPRRNIAKWKKQKMVIPVIGSDFTNAEMERKYTFYRLSDKGRRIIDTDEDSGQVSKLRHDQDNALHRTAKIDIAVSFYRNYPDWDVKFDYRANILGKRPDILVTMTKDRESRQFWVEIERKADPSRSYWKAKGLDEFFEKNRKKFKDRGLSFNAQILIVYMHTDYDVYNRKQNLFPPNNWEEDWGKQVGKHQYKCAKFAQKQKKDLKRKFDKLIDRCDFHPQRIKFMPMYDYWRISDKVWLDSKGKKSLLIQ